MDLGFQNFSQAGSLRDLNKFQDMYIPPHLYGPPQIQTTPTTEPPRYQQPPFNSPNDGFRDRIWGGWNTGASDNINRLADSGHGGGGGNSAAISALGLLAFLFFLNLIQNSLTNNRWNLLNLGLNRTQVQLGRSGSVFVSTFNPSWDLPLLNAPDGNGPIGKKEQRRSPPAKMGQTPGSIPLDPTDQNSRNFSRSHKGHRQRKTRKLEDPGPTPNLRKRFTRQTNGAKIRRGIPLKCLIEFYACAFSRRLDPKKIRRNSTQPIGRKRKHILPIKDLAGNNLAVNPLAPPLQTHQSCRVLLNECREARSPSPTLG